MSDRVNSSMTIYSFFNTNLYKVIMPNIFINDDEIDSGFFCKESKAYLKGQWGENNSVSKIFNFNDLELSNESRKAILETLKEKEENNAKQKESVAKAAKNNLVKSILGLSGLSLVVLASLSVVLFVPAVTAMVAVAMTTLLAIGPWVLPLLITAGIALAVLVIAPSLVFAWKKYKNTRAYDKSTDIVTKLTHKLACLDRPIDSENGRRRDELSDEISYCSRRSGISSLNGDDDFSNPIDLNSLAERLKVALAWRQAELAKNPEANVDCDAYYDQGDQVDSESNVNQIISVKFKKLYIMHQDFSLDKINASSVEAALKKIDEQKIKSGRNPASSSFYKLADQFQSSPQELSTNQNRNNEERNACHP